MQSSCNTLSSRRQGRPSDASSTPPTLVPITPYVSQRRRGKPDMKIFAEKIANADGSLGGRSKFDDPDDAPRTNRRRVRMERCPTPQHCKYPVTPIPRKSRRRYSEELVNDYFSLMFEWMMCSDCVRSYSDESGGDRRSNRLSMSHV